MLTHTTLLISKVDPIKYIFEKPSLSRRIARWIMVLIKYDIQYTTQKEIKGSVLEDHLAHQAVDDYQSMSFEFPYENIMLVTFTKNLDHIKDLNRDFDGLWFLMELLTRLVMELVL